MNVRLLIEHYDIQENIFSPVLHAKLLASVTHVEHSAFFLPPSALVRASTVDCGSLAPPAKGQVSFLNSSTGQGALVEYSCRPGYMVEGVALRQCQSNGEWSGIAPVCIGEMCLPQECLTIFKSKILF